MIAPPRPGRCTPSSIALVSAVAVALAFTQVAVARPAAAGAPIACFKEGPLAPVAVPSRVDPSASLASRPQPAFADDRWNTTATNGSTGVDGDPVVVTWGILQDGATIEPAFLANGETESPSNLVATLDAWFVERETWMALVQQSFDTWTAITGIQFVYEPNDDGQPIPAVSVGPPGVLGTRADIRIGGHPIDGPLSIVAYAYPPDEGDIVLDTTDPVFFQDSRSGFRKLRNTLTHEIGHAMGLEHVCPETASKLMEPTIVLDFDGPQHDDLIAMQSIYGDVRENDDDEVEALDLGIGGGELDARIDLSIDGSGDEDWIAIPAEPGLSVTVSVRPYGETYSIADSDFFTGSCDGVTSAVVDTLVSQDLAVQILASDGSTELAFADAAGAGGNELVTNVSVDGGGFLRVIGDGGAAPQIYDMTVEYVPEPSAGLGAGAALAVIGLLRRRRMPHGRGRFEITRP